MDFFLAIKNSFKMFTHWELYVITFGYLLVYSIFDFLPKRRDINYIRHDDDREEKKQLQG